MAIILVWGYFLGESLLLRYYLNGAMGALLLIVGWPVLKEFSKLSCLFKAIKLDIKEKLVISFIVFILFLYFYRVTIPWGDHDEAGLYGYLSKLISSGKSFFDLFYEGGPKGLVCSQLVQSWDAQLFGLVNDTYLVRLNRLVDFLFCAVGIFTFLKLMRVRLFWAFVGVAAFLSTPELSYLALSLKVDAVVMMFELAAFLAIIMAFFLYWNEKESRETTGTSFSLSAVALLLAAFATANRPTGAFSLLLCSACGWFFLTRWLRRPGLSFVIILAFALGAAFITAPGYMVNFLVYKNPLYPMQGFGPFQNGEYVYSRELFRAGWNIVGVPQGILQVYLVFVLGIGIELFAKVIPFLNHFPMAAVRCASMGWPYPLILSIFIWPFFRKSQKVLNMIIIIFSFQFICWSLGYHYSRILLATLTLMIMASILMADQDVDLKDKAGKILQKILKAWIVLSLVLSLALQIWWFEKRYFGPFLFTSQQRYQAKVRFLETKDYMEKNMLTFKEANFLNKFLINSSKRPIVYPLTYSSAVFHIIFDSRINLKDSGITFPYEKGQYLLVNPRFVEEKGSDFKHSIMQYFPEHVLTTPDTHWEVYTVSAGSRLK
ncbi:MAG: hypothetical protein HQL16_03030 [Candidatus Omnitrophica bacterium]|nr:hypothetical protein [Candidatus Omnitrophota bacterium]